MSATLTFLLNGEEVEAPDAAPTETLLDFLRYRRGLTGTKEGCAEGDCGACTVVVREIAPDGALRRRTANACIQLLPMLHGREVVTVEGLGGDHPVQRAMAEGHGSQCGFCTPGFVMSLWHGYETGAPVDPASVADQIAGNLCRCTGYGPILAAASTARATPAVKADADAALMRLETLRKRLDGALDHRSAAGRFIAPRSADALAVLIERHPEATILAGATDIGLWITKSGFRPETLIWLGDCADLDRIEDSEAGLSFGAAVSHERAMTALGGLAPDLGELWRRFASAQVRAAGTLCGNIANGSPIGDAAPALIVLGAEVTLRKGATRRSLPLEEFFIEYGKQDLAPGEFVESVLVPRPADPMDMRCYKVSKRFDQDITAVLAAIHMRLAGGCVEHARIAFGGMAGTPKRARAAEAALLGRALDEAAIEAAVRALGADFRPMDDHRASAAYRMKVAGNLLRKYLVERGAGDQRVTGRGRASPLAMASS
ncbi:xanthine dehydrogenase small subunit [Pikeienuella piscinae]|uniref:Xanthine dehydrogenase small subunit n=1 Tax=Pikeienuella piscinae TaxID=2748098 RepID=A0A7L5C0S9_9RHOB|nr:xanthine dehydrogenase small subunit [Pikeienuella piscinae]QIE56377.1 xanthine dehydrogenase small subunit [Pikeienuella piscinae]